MQDMREAQQTTAEARQWRVLERHLAASGASQAQATELWRQRAEELRKRLGRLVEAYRLALMAMRQAELDEVKQHNSQQGQFFQREIQQMAKADEEAQQRAGKIKKLKQALGKWQRQYLADALSQLGGAEGLHSKK
ncbi:unnamed protein product [Effrenium voratum]|nr:unnamed protein product [Effrenium voratum]